MRISNGLKTASTDAGAPLSARTPTRRIKIISGGQTGADRAALDVALALGLPHGGFVPRDRWAEDGPIPARYALTALPGRSLAQRTEANVMEADATLVVTHGRAAGGTALTLRLARRHARPLLHLDLAAIPLPEAVAHLVLWLRHTGCAVLNVAGPRASKDPTIYAATTDLLSGALKPVGALKPERDRLKRNRPKA
jgi:Circularly permutated YpsA SLOG family